MAVPSTPGEKRRFGLRRARWIAAGAAVSAAVVATGTVAVVNAAPSHGGTGGQSSPSDDGISRDDYGSATPFTPQQQTEQSPQFTPQQQTQSVPQFQPQTRSHGS